MSSLRDLPESLLEEIYLTYAGNLFEMVWEPFGELADAFLAWGTEHTPEIVEEAEGDCLNLEYLMREADEVGHIANWLSQLSEPLFGEAIEGVCEALEEIDEEELAERLRSLRSALP